MASMDFSVIVKLVDRISAPVRNIGNQFDHLNRKVDTSRQRLSALESVGSKLARIGSIASKVGAVAGVGMAGIGASATNVTAKYEDLGAVFETLEGSSEKASTSLEWVKKFTKETPYGLENTATAFSRLRAYGIDPMNGTLKTLGDTSAAMGKDIMDGVEMMADAVVGENERLKEFGIRGSKIKGTDLIEYSYKNKAGEQKTAQVNKNDQEEIRKTLMAIFDEKYMGAMDKRSKTFNGILSNMKDTISGLQGQFMQAGPFEVLKAGLQGRLDFLNKLSESGKIEQWGQRTAQFMTAAGNAASKLADMIGNANSKISAFVGGWGNLGRALGLIKDSAAGVGDLAKGGMPAWLKPGGGDKGAAMSPLLEQLRLIEKGDTLWNIAKQTGGIGSKYTEIAALNRDIIKDADKIFPGQQIRIPKLSGLPDWAKAKSVATSTEQSPVQPKQQGSAAPLVAIAELAKTNKVLAAAVLVRQAWSSTFAYLSAAVARVKAILSADFNAIADWAIANSDKIQRAFGELRSAAAAFASKLMAYKSVAQDAFGSVAAWAVSHKDQIITALSLLSGGIVGAVTRWPALVGKSVQWLSGVWGQALGNMQSRLPILQAHAKTVMGTVGNWFTSNSQKIQTALAGVATRAMEKFGVALEWLSAKSKDGSMTKWLDDMLAKLEPTISKVLAFGRGLLVAGAAIAATVIWVKDLVGGWENFGKLVVGLMVYAKFAGLIASTLAIVFSLGQILWATGSALAAFGGLLKSVGVFAFIGRVALMAYVLGAAALSSALPMLVGAFAVVKGAVLALSAVMMANPILAIVSAIAIAAVLVYTNWDRIVKWWNGSKLKEQVMPVATAAIDYAKSKWDQLKNWWNTSTLAQKAFAFSTAPIQIAKTLAADFFNWWLTTELGQKALNIATGAIDWAREKMQGFLDWWNNLSLKSITASIQGAMPSWMGGGEAKADGARASGGPVRAGGIYRVNELGPELLRQGGQTYLMADRDSNVVPLRNMVKRTNDRLFGEQGRDGGKTQQSIPQIIDFQQRQQKQAAQEVKTSGVLNIKIDSQAPVRVTQMQSTGMQLNVHTGPMGAVS